MENIDILSIFLTFKEPIRNLSTTREFQIKIRLTLFELTLMKINQKVSLTESSSKSFFVHFDIFK